MHATDFSAHPKGSTVNMNIMGWIYNRVTNAVGSPGHAVLGASLLIGKCFTVALH